jgi:glycerate dehydrogenase
MEAGWKEVLEQVCGDVCELEVLDDYDENLRRQLIGGSEALLAWNPHEEFVAEEWDGLEGIEFLQIMASGVDHLDFQKIPSDVMVASNAGAYAEAVAEHAVAMALSLARRLREEHEAMVRGEFNQRRLNRSLYGANVAIIGFGGIGQQISELLAPFGVDVYAVNSTGKTDRDVAWVGQLYELGEALQAADVAFLSLPLKPVTRGLIGRKELEVLGGESIFVNVARGEIIDQKALFEHLQLNPGCRAGLEAWWVEPFRHGEFRLEYPFFELPNVLGAPHNSAVVPGALEQGLRRAAENVVRWLEGETPEGIVDREAYVSA